jgi:hypothetical protein
MIYGKHLKIVHGRDQEVKLISPTVSASIVRHRECSCNISSITTRLARLLYDKRDEPTRDPHSRERKRPRKKPTDNNDKVFLAGDSEKWRRSPSGLPPPRRTKKLYEMQLAMRNL